MTSPIAGWWLKSAVVDGRDRLDGPLEVRASIQDLVVTLSPRASEIAGTVRDLVIGSDLTFSDRGEHELKGIPGRWSLYAAA